MYQKQPETAYVPIADVPQPPYTVAGLAGGQTYHFAVTAYNGSGDSALSNAVTTTLPPSDPTATATDTFTFQASDGTATSNVATVTVTILPGNTAPVASPGTLTTAEDTEASGTLSATDADGDPLTYSLSTPGSLGTVTLTNASTGAYTYTPLPNATVL